MKLILPANLPVTFFPTPGDDDRRSFPLMQSFGSIQDDKGGEIQALTDGRIIEFRHCSQAKAIVSINDILSEIVRATFYRIAPAINETSLMENPHADQISK